MLTAPTPSRSTTRSAALRIRSRERGLRICMPYCTVYRGQGEGTVPSRSTARLLAWGALAGQVAFVASWVVAGALQPRYSAIDSYVSELGARTAAHPWIVDVGVVLFGASFAALGFALLRALPRRRAATVATALFAMAGAALALEGVLRMDCSVTADAHCRALSDAGALSWHHYAHLWMSLVSQLLLAATPFAIAAALWPAPSAAASLGAGVSGLVAGVVVALLDSPTHGGAGLGQRAGLAVLQLWALIVAAGILYTTRGPRRLGPLVPMRPRDFLARRWSGVGRLEVWPWFLGRRLAGTAPVTREAVWLSERIWRFDDALHYADGRVQRRQTYCEFVSEDHVRLTAADLPDGADVWFEEGGYRFSEFRMAFPIGPVAVRIQVRDVSYVEPDGTFANVFEARAPIVGLPLARAVFHVRPLDFGTDDDAAP